MPEVERPSASAMPRPVVSSIPSGRRVVLPPRTANDDQPRPHRIDTVTSVNEATRATWLPRNTRNASITTTTDNTRSITPAVIDHAISAVVI
jgi:hypothetical protein